MDQEKNLEDIKDYSLVETVSEDVSTDIVLDIRTGIYNLFVNLYKSQIPEYGPKGSLQLAIDFLQEIIDNFQSAIQQESEL